MRTRSIQILYLLLIIRYPVCAEVSEPYGGMLVAIKGGDAINLISDGGFIQETEYQGTGEISVNGFLEDTEAAWTTNAFAGTHYIQLSTGEWTGILGNSNSRLILQSPLFPSMGVAYRIIPFNTLSSVFGAENSAGFTGGDCIAESDILMLWDVVAQQYAEYYYFNTKRNRWEDLYNNPAGTRTLYPDQSVVVLGRMDRKILLRGSVRLGRSSVFMSGDGGTSIIPNPYSFDILISNSGLEEYLQGGAIFAEADWVLDWDYEKQEYGEFYYFDSVDRLWRDLENNPAGDEDVIAAGHALVVIKNSPGQVQWIMDPPAQLR